MLIIEGQFHALHAGTPEAGSPAFLKRTRFLTLLKIRRPE